MLLAAILAAAASVDFLPPRWLSSLPTALLETRQEFYFALVVEGAFLMSQGTLVDIATRLRKRPPVWAVALIAAAVVMFSNETRAVLQLAWQKGAVVFIPMLLSLAERAAVLWQLPGRPELERIAARALIANRIITALVLLGLVTADMIARVALPNVYTDYSAYWPALAAGAIYYAVASFDGWRVRGRRFAEHPTVLFRYDAIGIHYMPPM